MKCNCGIYLRLNDSFPTYAFIDYCLSSANVSNTLKYFDSDLIKRNVLTNGNFPVVDCNSTIDDEKNETTWSKIEPFKKYFKCAKLAKSSYKTILVIS